jgi:hypothetical protein
VVGRRTDCREPGLPEAVLSVETTLPAAEVVIAIVAMFHYFVAQRDRRRVGVIRAMVGISVNIWLAIRS